MYKTRIGHCDPFHLLNHQKFICNTEMVPTFYSAEMHFIFITTQSSWWRTLIHVYNWTRATIEMVLYYNHASLLQYFWLVTYTFSKTINILFLQFSPYRDGIINASGPPFSSCQWIQSRIQSSRTHWHRLTDSVIHFHDIQMYLCSTISWNGFVFPVGHITQCHNHCCKASTTCI